MRKYPSGCVLWLELPEAPDLRCWKTQSMAPSITRAVQPRDPLPAVGDPHISSWSNLINFFTDRLGQSNPTAGESVNIWTGTGSLMPLVGAFVADSYLGRYATIINASLLYILGLVLLTLSAVFPALSPSNCPKRNKTISCSPQLQIIFFFLVIFSGSWARWAQVLHPGFWSRPI
uniref:Protein NRT1/ PTR family 5.10 n=1 Tax=Vitis vinifera TaxID=29760 RepID=F6I401_VITVI